MGKHSPEAGVTMQAAMLLEARSPKLSIVIVNSDGTEDTLNCLNSIFHNPPTDPFEVICVDNCSTAPFLPMLQEKYPRVRTVLAPQRQGFSKNYNLGMRQATGENVMILNNDTLVHAGALDTLLEAIRRNPSYGMVGPRLLWGNGKIQTVCARSLLTPYTYLLTQFLLDPALPTGKLWDHYRRWRLEKQASGVVPCISGACMLVSRQALDHVGTLDESYDFYYEDVEWCRRMQGHGYQVAYITEACITHLGDQSLSKVKEWAKQSEYRSALHYFRQYHRLSTLGAWGLWLVTGASYFERAVAYWLYEKFSRQSAYAQTYWNLFRWVLRQTPNRSQ
jgi:N-acetylglucosaminyl-diphospho-decaprenol L-rhamnosyltransferase